MQGFSKLPNVFAWQDEGQWYYVDDQREAPSHAVEMWRLDDGNEVFLSVSRGAKGSFVRGAKRLNESGDR